MQMLDDMRAKSLSTPEDDDCKSNITDSDELDHKLNLPVKFEVRDSQYQRFSIEPVSQMVDIKSPSL